MEPNSWSQAVHSALKDLGSFQFLSHCPQCVGFVFMLVFLKCDMMAAALCGHLSHDSGKVLHSHSRNHLRALLSDGGGT